MRKLIFMIEMLFFKALRSKRYFIFNNNRYRYFFDTYNCTWRNERAIEIPIVQDFIKSHPCKKILEIGNVLSHYFPTSHDIIDKYEKAKGVINQDIVDFNPKQKYDLIVSISTFEHIGWDEKDYDPEKVILAIKKVKKLLNKGGKAIITIPIGHNHFLDRSIDEGIIKFSEELYLKRISRSNRWIETDKKSAFTKRYAKPYPGGNGLVIGIIEK